MAPASQERPHDRWPCSHEWGAAKEDEMARQVCAVVIGVVVAVVAIFALFDARVSFRGMTAQLTQLSQRKGEQDTGKDASAR